MQRTTTTTTLKDFLNAFANEGQALYYIDNALAERKVTCSEITLPYYEWCERENKMVSRYDCPPNTYSYMLTIEDWFGLCNIDGSVAIQVEFLASDKNAYIWFIKNLRSELDGITKSHAKSSRYDQPSIETQALLLQRGLNEDRANKTRRYILASGAEMSPPSFYQRCQDIAKLLNENKAISDQLLSNSMA